MRSVIDSNEGRHSPCYNGLFDPVHVLRFTVGREPGLRMPDPSNFQGGHRFDILPRGKDRSGVGELYAQFPRTPLLLRA